MTKDEAIKQCLREAKKAAARGSRETARVMRQLASHYAGTGSEVEYRPRGRAGKEVE